MSNTATLQLISESEYLEGERVSPVKYEFVDGRTFAMAGASKRHGTIALNVGSALRNHLRGGPCRGFVADIKVRVARARAYYYPDVVASCAPEDLAADAPSEFLTAPNLVIEVLSPATESVDRREKWLNYRSVPSLQEYVLIDQARCWIEVYRRAGDTWLQIVHSELSGNLELASVGLTMALTAVYEDVAFDPIPG